MEKQSIIRGATIVVAAIAASITGAQYLFEGTSRAPDFSATLPSDTSELRSAGILASGSAPAETTDPEPTLFDEATFLALSDVDARPLARAEANDHGLQHSFAQADKSLPGQTDGCAIQVQAQDMFDALIELSLSAPCHPNERVVISHGDLAFSAHTNADGTYSAYLPALSTLAKIDVFVGNSEFQQAEVAVPEADAHYRVVLQWTGSAGLGLHAYHRGAEFGSPGHLHALSPFDPDQEDAFLISLGDHRGPESMAAQVYSVPVTSADQSRVELELKFNAGQCGAEYSGYLLYAHAGVTSDIKEVSFVTPDCPSEDGFIIMALPLLGPQHATMPPVTAPVMLDLSE